MLKYYIFFLFIFINVFSYAQTDTSVPVKKMKPVPPWWVDRFRVSAAVFFPLNNTIVEVGDEDGTFGTTVDLEDDLGLATSTTTFLGGLQWHASRRSKFELNYYYIGRNSTKTLEEDVEFKDTIYPANSKINASFSTGIFQFSYGYALLLNPRYEAGLAIGAHVVGVKVGMGSADNAGSADAETDFNFTAPLPDLGIWGGYAINKQWAVNGAFNYLSLTIGDFTGRILSYNAGVTYSILKNLSASLGYAGLNFKVNGTKDAFKGYFKWGNNGPVLTVHYAFGKNKWQQ
jgi:hypothetical protein